MKAIPFTDFSVNEAIKNTPQEPAYGLTPEVF